MIKYVVMEFEYTEQDVEDIILVNRNQHCSGIFDNLQDIVRQFENRYRIKNHRSPDYHHSIVVDSLEYSLRDAFDVEVAVVLLMETDTLDGRDWTNEYLHQS